VCLWGFTLEELQDWTASRLRMGMSDCPRLQREVLGPLPILGPQGLHSHPTLHSHSLSATFNTQSPHLWAGDKETYFKTRVAGSSMSGLWNSRLLVVTSW
jgi:hypothetical protein